MSSLASTTTFTECVVEDCYRPRLARGYCRPHYYRLRRHGDVEADSPIRGSDRSPEQRFWEKVDRGNADDCWEWIGARLPAGYGKFSLKGKIVAAHRFAYGLLVGPIPLDGSEVCHRCDNPPCCNPAHLFVGTRSDNQLDSVAKGRHYLTKLTSEQVIEIRRRYRGDRGEQVALAKEFGVTRSAIWRVVRGRRS